MMFFSSYCGNFSNSRNQQGPSFWIDLSGSPYLKLMYKYKDYIWLYLNEVPRVVKFREWDGGCQGPVREMLVGMEFYWGKMGVVAMDGVDVPNATEMYI